MPNEFEKAFDFVSFIWTLNVILYLLFKVHVTPVSKFQKIDFQYRYGIPQTIGYLFSFFKNSQFRHCVPTVAVTMKPLMILGKYYFIKDIHVWSNVFWGFLFFGFYLLHTKIQQDI